jgi:hypothetical protein
MESAIWHEESVRSSRDGQHSSQAPPPAQSSVREAIEEIVAQDDPNHVEDPLSFSAKLFYALPSFSTTSLTLLISLYANDFYGASSRSSTPSGILCLSIYLDGPHETTWGNVACKHGVRNCWESHTVPQEDSLAS